MISYGTWMVISDIVFPAALVSCRTNPNPSSRNAISLCDFRAKIRAGSVQFVALHCPYRCCSGAVIAAHVIGCTAVYAYLLRMLSGARLTILGVVWLSLFLLR